MTSHSKIMALALFGVAALCTPAFAADPEHDADVNVQAGRSGADVHIDTERELDRAKPNGDVDINVPGADVEIDRD